MSSHLIDDYLNQYPRNYTVEDKLIINFEIIFPLTEIIKYCKIKLSYCSTSKENEKTVLTS